MAEQDFQPFAAAENANVISQSDYLASNWLATGFSAGIAYSDQVNKVLRQSSIITTAIAQAIADTLGVSVIDDGTIATIESNFLALFHNLSQLYGIDTGNVNSLVVSLSASQRPANLAALEGIPIIIKIANTNTGATTLNVDGLGAIQILNPDNSVLSAGQLVQNGLATVLYDGSNYGLLSITTGPITTKINEWTQPQTWDAVGTFKSNLSVTGSVTGGALVSTSSVSAIAGALITGYDANGAQLRTVNGNYGAFIRNDGASFYLLQTASGNQYGTFNTFRPFAWNFTTGAVSLDQSGAGVTLGGPLACGAIVASGNINTAGGLTASGAVNGGAVVRAVTGSYGVSLYTDGTYGYLIGSPAGNQTGAFSALRPLYWNLATGAIGMDGGGAGIATGGGLAVGAALTTGSNASINGTINSNGNIVANLGRLRAAFGAFGSGDANCAAILNDWTVGFAAVNNGYVREPNGVLEQTIAAGVPCGGGLVTTLVTLPVTFPNASVDAIISFLGNSPPGSNNPGNISVQPYSNSQVAVTTNYQLSNTLGVVIRARGY